MRGIKSVGGHGIVVVPVALLSYGGSFVFFSRRGALVTYVAGVFRFMYGVASAYLRGAVGYSSAISRVFADMCPFQSAN